MRSRHRAKGGGGAEVLALLGLLRSARFARLALLGLLRLACFARLALLGSLCLARFARLACLTRFAQLALLGLLCSARFARLASIGSCQVAIAIAGFLVWGTNASLTKK